MPASVLSETQLACETPAVQEPGAVALGVVLRYPHTKRRVDVPFDGEALSFVYQLEPSVLTIEPKSGSARGGTPVTLSGAGFADTPELSVRFAVDGQTRGAAVDVRASFVSDAAARRDAERERCGRRPSPSRSASTPHYCATACSFYYENVTVSVCPRRARARGGSPGPGASFARTSRRHRGRFA